MSREVWTPLIVPPRLDPGVLSRLLPMLTGLDRDFLREYPLTPPLYESGIIYIRDAENEEQWLTIPAIIARGAADCKSLACWRIAELQLAGEEGAEAHWTSTPTPGGGELYHILVRRASGEIEDPSAKLGMV